VKAKSTGHEYFTDFLEAGRILKGVLSFKEYEMWCTEKMLLRQQPFAEKTFIQYSVETSVVRFFSEMFPAEFKAEAKINPNNQKDVDCQFIDSGFKYNVEVKCSDFISKEEIDSQDAYKFETVGRLPDKGESAIREISQALNEAHAKKEEGLKPHLDLKKMDNNLKDFLELAHKKFDPTPKEEEVNILLVGCDDDRDIQNWFNYLLAEQGLFTKHPFADNTKYKNVDLVVLTNLYFKHNRYFDKQVKNSWTLENSFNLIFGNPYRHIQKENAIKHFMNLLPNFTQELQSYQVPGDAPDFVKNVVKIPWFVKDNLEKNQGKFLF
jgi:hypothetical protein